MEGVPPTAVVAGGAAARSATIERIAENPDRGRACDDIQRGYRRYAIGSHLVDDVVGPDGVDVVRILHQRMGPTRHL